MSERVVDYVCVFMSCGQCAWCVSECANMWLRVCFGSRAFASVVDYGSVRSHPDACAHLGAAKNSYYVYC